MIHPFLCTCLSNPKMLNNNFFFYVIVVVRLQFFRRPVPLSARLWVYGCRDRTLVSHLLPVRVHLEKTLTETCCNRTQTLSVSLCISTMPPRPAGVCDRPSPGELATVMNGHLSTLYRLTKSYAYAFMTNFCCIALLSPPVFWIKLDHWRRFHIFSNCFSHHWSLSVSHRVLWLKLTEVNCFKPSRGAKEHSDIAFPGF